MKKVRGILVSITDDQQTEIKEVNINSWRDYAKLIKCDTFDVITARWNDKEVSIYCDDGGLLKKNYGRKLMGVSSVIFGDIVIMGGIDKDGNTLPLPDSFTVDTIAHYIGRVSHSINA